MKTLTTTLFAACLALAGTVASAQDTTKADTKMDTKKAMSTEGCKGQMNTMKGQKRSDPPTADTADKCADMKADHAMKTKKGMKKDSGMTQEQPAAPSK